MKRFLGLLTLLPLALAPACGSGGEPALAFVLSDSELTMPQDATAALTLDLLRLGGYAGNVSITVTGLPGGVTAPPVDMAPADTTTDVAFHSSSLAVSGRRNVTVRATGTGVAPASATVRLLVLGPPGTLDADFGSGGRIVTPVITSTGNYVRCFPEDLVVQGDDRVVVVGRAYVPDEPAGATDTSHVLLVRYDRNGDLDSDFGVEGVVLTRVQPDGVEAFSSAAGHDAVQSRFGGGIVVAGAVSTDTNGFGDQLVLRYRSDGSLDPAFGDGGVVVTEVGEFAKPRNDQAHAVAEQPDGKLVVAGWVKSDTDSEPRFAMTITRYLSNGDLDLSFGIDGTGYTIHAFMGSASQANDVAILGDGSILVVGWAALGTQTVLAVLKLRPSGLPDTSYGANGQRVLAHAGNHHGTVVSTRGAAPMMAGVLDDDGLITRFLDDGGIDTSWLIGGVNRTYVDGSIVSYADLLETADQVYGAGTVQTVGGGGSGPLGSDYEALVSRYIPNGLNDILFGTLGLVRLRYAPAATSTCVAMGRQSDGTLVVTGTAGTLPQIGVARLWP